MIHAVRQSFGFLISFPKAPHGWDSLILGCDVCPSFLNQTSTVSKLYHIKGKNIDFLKIFLRNKSALSSTHPVTACCLFCIVESPPLCSRAHVSTRPTANETLC